MSQQHICDQYTPFLFQVGEVTIVAGLILGVALAAAAVIVALKPPPGQAAANLAAPPASVIDSIRAFIQAIASAPTWLALFGGGLLLVWMAANMSQGSC